MESILLSFLAFGPDPEFGHQAFQILQKEAENILRDPSFTGQPWRITRPVVLFKEIYDHAQWGLVGIRAILKCR